MWFNQNGQPDWSAAIRHLRKTSKAMGETIDRVGPCRLVPQRDHFAILCKAIFNQQLSMKAAATLFGRFVDQFPGKRPRPQALLDLVAADPECLRKRGVSRQKNRYLQDLAEHFAAG